MIIRTQCPPLSPARALTDRTTTIMAVAAGLAVANVYAVQPLLDVIGHGLTMRPADLGLAVTLTQLGYAAGLILLVPLGDLFDRRRLIIGQTGLSVAAIATVALARSQATFLMAVFAIGMLAVTVQTLVAFAGALSSADRRGAVVGKVTGGIVIGILAARAVSGSVSDILGWRAVYVLSALASLAATFALSRALPPDCRRPVSRGYGAILRSLPGLFLRDRVLMLRAAFAFIIFAAFSTFWTALVLPLTMAPYELSHTQVGLFGLVGIAGALGARGAGKLVDRGWAQQVTGGALLLLCLSWGLIAMLSLSLWWVAGGIVALDLAVQAVHVTSQTLIVGRHAETAGRTIAGYMLFYSLGSATGAGASTYAFSVSGWSGVCMTGAAISAIGLVLWALTGGLRIHRDG
jgi:predicted MFS family arabinose efflux permease